jgi:hypothetical protein
MTTAELDTTIAGVEATLSALKQAHARQPALTLTIKTAGAPTVQLTYDPDYPIAQTAVTLLDELSGTRAWLFDDVVADAFVFLLHYVRDVRARRHRPASASSGGRLCWQPFGGRCFALDRITRRVVAWCGHGIGAQWWVILRSPTTTYGPFATPEVRL